MKSTKTASLEALRAMKERGEISAPPSGTPEVDLPEDFWDSAKVVEPRKKESVHLRVDAEILEYFRADGKGHLTRMNAVLRSYVEAQKKRHTP